MTGESRSAWFPLALLGFLLLAAALWEMRTPTGWFAYAPAQGFHVQFLYGIGEPVLRPAEEPSSWRWGTPRQLAVTVALLGTVVWYRRRVLLIGGAGLVVVVLSAALAAAARAFGGQVLATAVGVPLVLLGACAGAWVWFRPGYRPAVVAGVVCLALAAYALIAAFDPDLVDVVTAALGLGVLAVLARSVLLGLVAVLFALAGPVFGDGAPGLLGAGAVALAGALAVLGPGGRTMAR
ncbi:hypothetical protein FHX82_002468 [Amycolatopsis bartoniae]|uniref:Uncharacterized protein n=1 Tax=Amycolatopsis bartoniae TaxID=941986 RepID=A0A8H9J0Y4_9PSEU|nr:hypothetical protein [Amycolatopsis bartoniae]MBB2935414.1 hypothetical protein [Amycolatopsis bartoniae]GHF75916.1 hypothetical protein GCM10017566_57190 [Amycolatopsis bartoniae]